MSPRLLRPRAAGGFNPRSISGLALWLDASDGSTLFQNSDGTVPATATGAPVGYWGDKSGNNRHVTQATAGDRPTVAAVSVNGRRCIDFDGTSDNIWAAPGPTSDNLTALCVYRYDTLGGIAFDFTHQGDITNAIRTESSGFLNSLGLQVAGVGSILHRLDSTRAFVSDQTARSSATSAYAAGRVALSSLSASFGAVTTGRYGGVDGASLSETTRFNGGAWSAVSLASRRNSATVATGSVFMDGQICEIVLYERNLPVAERQRVERYLASKWGITLAPQVSNADAQDWINRVYSNGGTVSTSTAAAVNTFCDDIDAAGIRDRFFRLNLFCGNSDSALAAVRTPLYRGQSLGGTQFGNLTDVNAGNLFAPADYSEGNGLTGNGSSKYLQTGLASSAFITGGNARSHLAVYKRTSTNSGVLLSARSTTLGNTWEFGAGGNLLGGGTGSFPVPSTHDSLIGITRTNSTDLVSFRRTSLATANAASASVTGTSIPFAVFARNDQSTDTNAYSTNLFSNQTLAAYSIGIGLDATQIAAYDAAMQAFQTALGRNV
jgi:hypothetical protein